MARICTRCNRPLDPEHHVEGPPSLQILADPRARGTRRLARRLKTWGCKMRLITTSPVTGKVLAANSGQRLNAAGDTRYVHEARFKGDLAPS